MFARIIEQIYKNTSASIGQTAGDEIYTRDLLKKVSVLQWTITLKF